MNSPLITIVIPVKNRAELLPRTLRSITAQKLRPLRVIAVDNGSTDSSWEILEKWSNDAADAGIDVTLLREEKPGASAARNRGLKEVTSPYVMFFDSDDEMLPGHTQRLAECIAANPEAQLIGFDIAERDEDGWTTPKSVNDSDLLRGHILHATFATQRYVAKTGLVRNSGGWNEELLQWDDLELGVRLLVNADSAIVFHGDAGVIVHPSEDSISAIGYAAGAACFEKAIEEMETTLRARGKEDYLIWTDTKRMVLGALCRREGNKTAAQKIEEKALNRHKKWKSRLKLSLAGASVRISGRGGCSIAKLLFSRRADEQA